MGAEARALVRHFGLSAVDGHAPFPLYRGEGMRLAACGQGAIAAATAVGYLAGGDDRPGVWINVGIAGHRDRSLGEVVLAHKIVERATERSWYPSLVFDPPCEGAIVCTVRRVEREFPDERVYEMEAAGFFAAASRFATSELVQVLKVVSDNRQSSTHELTLDKVEELTAAAIAPLERVIECCTELAGELAARADDPTELESYLDAWHFTVTQRRQLRRLLRRLAALDGVAPTATALAGAASAKEALGALRDVLASRSVIRQTS